MKYLYLIYEQEKSMAGMSMEAGEAMMGEYFAFTEGIRRNSFVATT